MSLLDLLKPFKPLAEPFIPKKTGQLLNMTSQEAINQGLASPIVPLKLTDYLKPKIEIKTAKDILPALKKAVAIPQKAKENWQQLGNLVADFTRFIPELGLTLADVPHYLSTGKTLPSVRIPFYGELSSIQKKTEKDVAGGMNPALAILYHGSVAILDVTIIGGLLDYAATKILVNVKPPEMAYKAASQVLGVPILKAGTPAVDKAFNDLAKIYHPDMPWGNTATMAQLNKARAVMSVKPGITQTIRRAAEILKTPIGKLGVTETVPFIRPFLTETAGYQPTKPFQPTRQPAMGLSLREVPEKPIISIPKNIEPNHVITITDEVSGGVEFKVIPKGQLNEFITKIDNTEIGIAGELINGKRYHITAQTPVQIMEKSKTPYTGVAKIEDIPSKPLAQEAGKVIRTPSPERLLGIEKPPLITKREDVLLRARIRNEARGAKAGAIEARRLTRDELITKFKDSRENVRQIKNDLIKYIDENLPTEAKGKLTQALMMDNLTRKNAASIFSRVERMKETLTRKELVGEIKELSVPKGNLAVDYQKQISETISGIDLVKPTEATVKKLKGLRDYIRKEGTPLNIQSKYIEKLDRLTQKNVSQLTTAELTELKDTLNQLQKLGKLKQDLKYKYHERERRVALDRLLASTQNIDPKVSGLRTKWDTYKIGTKKAYMDTLHTPRVADMIDGFKGYRGENAKLIKQLGRKETNAKEITRATVNSALEEIQNLGIKELTADQQIRIMINIRYREGAYDQVKTLMEKNGLKEIPELTDQENKIIEIIKKNTNQYTDDIAAIYEEVENKPFHKLDEYILPLKYEKEFNLVPSQTIEQGRFRTTQTFKGFSYERQKGVTKTPRTDILAIFEEAINEQQWYLNMQPELENIKYLVKSPEYLTKGGEMASNWWRTELDVVARRGWSATARSNPMLRQGRINLNQAILGYKLSSILMQPFAVFDAMAYAQSRYGTMAALNVLKEFSKAWIIPKYAKQIIAESPALQLRQAGELAIEETLKRVGRAKGLLNSFIRGGMSLLQKADVRTAAGVEGGLLNILEKYGVPNAKEESEFLMNMASGSNEVVYRPHILASGEGARTWFTFQTFFMNRWGIMIHDLIRSGIIKGGGATGWKGLWKRISALIGLGIFIAGSIAENEARKAIYETTTGKELPDESMLKTAVMFIPEQVPYFGNLIEAADRGGDASPPLIRTVENVFSGGTSLISGAKPETKIKGGLRMAEAGITLTTGIPGTAQFFDLLENIFGGIIEPEKATTGLPGLPSLPSLPKLPKLPALPKL